MINRSLLFLHNMNILICILLLHSIVFVSVQIPFFSNAPAVYFLVLYDLSSKFLFLFKSLSLGLCCLWIRSRFSYFFNRHWWNKNLFCSRNLIPGIISSFNFIKLFIVKIHFRVLQNTSCDTFANLSFYMDKFSRPCLKLTCTRWGKEGERKRRKKESKGWWDVILLEWYTALGHLECCIAVGHEGGYKLTSVCVHIYI